MVVQFREFMLTNTFSIQQPLSDKERFSSKLISDIIIHTFITTFDTSNEKQKLAATNSHAFISCALLFQNKSDLIAHFSVTAELSRKCGGRPGHANESDWFLTKSILSSFLILLLHNIN